MNRERETADVIDLGAASVETQGLPAPKVEDTYGIPGAGLSDD